MGSYRSMVAIIITLLYFGFIINISSRIPDNPTITEELLSAIFVGIFYLLINDANNALYDDGINGE